MTSGIPLEMVGDRPMCGQCGRLVMSNNTIVGVSQMQDQENSAVPNPEAEPAVSATAPDQSSLEQQLADTEARLAEMHDAFMRAKADGENIPAAPRKTWPRRINSPSRASPRPWCRSRTAWKWR